MNVYRQRWIVFFFVLAGKTDIFSKGSHRFCHFYLNFIVLTVIVVVRFFFCNFFFALTLKYLPSINVCLHSLLTRCKHLCGCCYCCCSISTPQVSPFCREERNAFFSFFLVNDNKKLLSLLFLLLVSYVYICFFLVADKKP